MGPIYDAQEAPSMDELSEQVRRPQGHRARHHFTHNVVICCQGGNCTELGPVLASFILDGVRHVHLAGPGGGQVKSLIGAILARSPFEVRLNVTWYEGETLESVISFARGYCHQPAGGTQIVHL